MSGNGRSVFSWDAKWCRCQSSRHPAGCFVQVGILHKRVVLHPVVVDSIVGVRDSKLSWLGGCCKLGCCLGTTSDYLNMDTLDIGMIEGLYRDYIGVLGGLN